MPSVITIVEPKEHIANLWGKQKVKEGETYRLMKYVLRVDHDGKALLHNVVTGQLVILAEKEKNLFNKLPNCFTDEMSDLVEAHFLVPVEFDESKLVIQIRTILQKLDDANKSAVKTYAILPTTACNARCYYCFEQGIKPSTMTVDTAEHVIRYIVEHCEDDFIGILWFGGEPTLAAKRIDQICIGLQKYGINYSSSIITNGYLFDEKMSKRASCIWKVSSATISIDGAEEKYNKIKAYKDTDESPYQRVLRNIGLLLSEGISIDLRMNFDLDNYDDFKLVVSDLKQRYSNNPLLHFRAHQINGEYSDANGIIHHGDNAWYQNKILELNNVSRKNGLLPFKLLLPSLDYKRCKAGCDNSMAITPKGYFVKCPEQLHDNQIIGDLKHGIVNYELVQKWKETASYENCKICNLFPYCVRMANCATKSDCCHHKDLLAQFEVTMRNVYERKFSLYR